MGRFLFSGRLLALQIRGHRPLCPLCFTSLIPPRVPWGQHLAWAALMHIFYDLARRWLSHPLSWGPMGFCHKHSENPVPVRLCCYGQMQGGKRPGCCEATIGLFQDFLMSSVTFHSEGRKPQSPSLRMDANGKKYCITALYKIQTVKTIKHKYFILHFPDHFC